MDKSILDQFSDESSDSEEENSKQNITTNKENSESIQPNNLITNISKSSLSSLPSFKRKRKTQENKEKNENKQGNENKNENENENENKNENKNENENDNKNENENIKVNNKEKNKNNKNDYLTFANNLYSPKDSGITREDLDNLNIIQNVQDVRKNKQISTKSRKSHSDMLTQGLADDHIISEYPSVLLVKQSDLNENNEEEDENNHDTKIKKNLTPWGSEINDEQKDIKQVTTINNENKNIKQDNENSIKQDNENNIKQGNENNTKLDNENNTKLDNNLKRSLEDNQLIKDNHNDDKINNQVQRKLKRPKTRKTESQRQQLIIEAQKREIEIQKALSSSNLENRNSIDNLVRLHYNARENSGIQKRKQSPIIKLKSFNNWVKSVLIQKFAVPDGITLDLGCGKGGDLMKWDKANIKGYIGIDLAELSIEQANDRFRGLKRKRSVSFMPEFFIGDCFSKPLYSIVPREWFPVNVVSAQFCLHYSFESEKKARQTLENISGALDVGGKFIGTIPSSDVISKFATESPPGTRDFGNSCYHIKFAEDLPKNGEFRPPYGHKYNFYLEDAIADLPEYVVPFEALRGIASTYNLELIYKKGFKEVFETELHEKDDFFELAKRLKVIDPISGEREIQGDEWEASQFYIAFAFEKTL